MSRTRSRRGMRRAAVAVAQVGFLAVVASQAASALEASWDLLRPSNSGIPGEEIRRVTFTPGGELWVAARWPFWAEGGIGRYDAEQEIWTVWADWESPIPTPLINDIAFDAIGVAWIATGQGLVRHDGATWELFNAANTPMAHSTIRNLAVAPDGHVWVNNSSSSFGGDAIWDFDGVDTWIQHAVPDLPWAEPWTDMASVHVDADGHVWTANNTLFGIAEYDGSTWTLHGEDVAKFASIDSDGAGNVWMIGNPVGGDHAMFRFDGSTFTRYGLASPTVLRVDPEDDAVYVGNWHGVVQRSTDGGGSFSTWLSGLNRVVDLAFEPGSSDVWVGTAGAVGHFATDGTWIRDFNTYNTGLPWYWIDRMTTDDDGNFWVASGEAGVSRFDGERWRNWGTHNAGAEPYPFGGNEPIGTVYQDASGTHWFGGNGIARWHAETGTFDGFWNWENNPGMGVGLWTHFAEAADGTLFAMEKHGATYRFNQETQRWDRDTGVSPYGPLGVPAMLSDSLGRVWIVAWFDLHMWDGTAWTTVELPYRDYFFDLQGIYSAVIGPDDVMWLGTVEGLVRWDGTTFTLLDASNTPMPASGVWGIDVRDDGLIGLALHDGSTAASGIAFFDGDPADPSSWWTSSYGASPQPHWQLSHAAFDPQGRFWASALSMGVAILDTEPVVAVDPTSPLIGPRAILAQNAPNPVRTRSAIPFEVVEAGNVALRVYDLQGRRVRTLLDRRLAPGRHVVDLDATALTPGVYFYELQTARDRLTRRMVITR